MFSGNKVGCVARRLRFGNALGVVSALASVLVLLSACGGGSDGTVPPVVVVPPDAARAWSAPQLSAASFTLGYSVTAHADACGGVSVVGINGANRVAQRYSPKSGWQAPQTLVSSNAGDFQPLDVGGVPHFFYRDSQNWVRGAFDCASNTWGLSAAFPVEYLPPISPESVPFAIRVTVSESFEHTMLAATVLSDNRTIMLREFRGGAWSTATTMKAFNTAASGSTPVSYLSSLSVIRSRDGDTALLNLGSVYRAIAFRATSAIDFVVISDTRGCFGHFCVAYADYSAPRLELDGSATTFFGTSYFAVKPEWFRATATGLQPLLASSTAWLAYGETVRLVRPDGVAQWISAEQNSPSAMINEGGVTATWTNLASFENAACRPAGCRSFSSPETGHVVTLLNPADTPVRSPQIAISNRTGNNHWEGSFTRSLSDLWAAGPNATSTGNGTMQLITYRATSSSEIIVATLTSTRLTGETDVTPFALWK